MLHFNLVLLVAHRAFIHEFPHQKFILPLFCGGHWDVPLHSYVIAWDGFSNAWLIVVTINQPLLLNLISKKKVLCTTGYLFPHCVRVIFSRSSSFWLCFVKRFSFNVKKYKSINVWKKNRGRSSKTALKPLRLFIPQYVYTKYLLMKKAKR